MSKLRKILCVIVAMAMLMGFMPKQPFNLDVLASSQNVSSWADIYALRGSNGVISNVDITLTQNITLPTTINVLSGLDNVNFDGDGYIITFPSNAVLQYEDETKKVHYGLGLFGDVNGSSIKNVMFKAVGDVHAGKNQGTNFNTYNPEEMVDIGLVAAALRSTIVSNVAIVNDSPTGSYNVKKEGGYSSYANLNAGLLAGAIYNTVTISGLYIDMSILAGVRQHNMQNVSVGLVAGTSNSSVGLISFSNFQVQGKVEAYSGSGNGYPAAGGLLGRMSSSFLNRLSLSNGIVTAITNSHDYNEAYTNGLNTHSGDGFRGAVIGSDSSFGDIIVSNVLSTYSSETNDNQERVSLFYNLPTSQTITNQSAFNENWVETNEGGIGGVALKWLVNPENEGISFTESNSTFTLNSGNTDYATKDSNGVAQWTISGGAPLKGKLATADSLIVERTSKPAAVTGMSIYTREQTTPTSYFSGGTYYFGLEYGTSNYSGATAVKWSVDSTSVGDGVTIDNGTLTIPEDFSLLASKNITITATVNGSNGLSNSITETITVAATTIAVSATPTTGSTLPAAGLSAPLYSSVGITIDNAYAENGSSFSVSNAVFTAKKSDNSAYTLPAGSIAFDSNTNNVVFNDLSAIAENIVVTMTFDIAYNNVKKKVGNTLTFSLESAGTTSFYPSVATPGVISVASFTALPLGSKGVTTVNQNVESYDYSFKVTNSVANTSIFYKLGSQSNWLSIGNGINLPEYDASSPFYAISLSRVPVDSTDVFENYATSNTTVFSFDPASLSYTDGASVVRTTSTTQAQQEGNQFAVISDYTLTADSAGDSTAEVTITDLFLNNPLAENGIAKGDILFTIENNHKYRYRDVEFGGDGYTFVTGTGGGLARPIITPQTNISLSDGIRITHPDPEARIYYSLNDTDNPTTADTLYTSEIFIDKVPSTIKAVAEKNGAYSAVSTLVVDISSIGIPPQPTIASIGSNAYSPSYAYSGGETITFAPPVGWDLNSGTIKYNFTTSSDLANTGLVYDPTNKPVIPTAPTSETKSINLFVIYINNALKDNNSNPINITSNVVEYRINYYSTASNEIIANQDVGKPQFPNTIVNLSLPNSELAQINAQNVEALSYESAVVADDQLKALYNDPASSVTLTIDDSNLDPTTTRYISYEYDEAYEGELFIPVITFNHTAGSPSSPSSLVNYTYAKRIVKQTYTQTESGSNVLAAIDVSYVAPVDIVLRGDPGTYYTIFAKVVPNGAVGVLPSNTAQFVYTIAPQVEQITMSPDPTLLENEFNENTRISLTTISSGTTIYYGVNESPDVEFNEATQSWVAAEGTNEYRSPFRLGSSQASTTIYAIAVSNDNTMQPVENTFYINVSQLPPADPPSPLLPNGSTVVSGDAIRFTTELISGEIYYTLSGGEPSPDDYVEWIEANPGQTPPDNNVRGTYKYDDNTGIIASFEEGENIITIVAVAYDGGEIKQFTASDPVRVQYQIQSASSPTSIPITAIDNIPVVVPGTSILLYSTTPNAKIFYTDDGSEPQFISTTSDDPITGEKITEYLPQPGSTTKLIGVDGEPVMPMGTQSFFTVRALAVAQDYVQSSESLLMFQPPAPVQPASPNVSHLQPIARNTPITFITSTEDARIIYKTYDTLAEAKADAVDSVGNPSLMSETNGTLFTDAAPLIFSKDTVVRVVAEKDKVQSVEVFYEFTIAPQLSKPSLSIPNGSIIYPGAVINISGDANGEISYTTNGDDPKAADAADLLYGNSYVVTADYDETVTVKVISTAQGYTPSETQVYSYTVCKEEDYLTTTPTNENSIRTGDTITLSTTISSGEIYYTTDNSNPVVGGSGGGSGVTITANGNPGETFTVKAIVSTTGATPGNVVVTTFRMAEKTPAPTASIPTDAVTLDGAFVTLSASEGTIYYSTDGSDPTTSSAIYENPIAANKSMVLKAIAIEDGKEPSEIVSYVYTRAGDTAAPEFSVNSGSIEQNSQIKLTSSTPGAQIYYTTSGESPQSDSLDSATLYNGAITVSAAVTIKAIAVAEGLHASVVTSSTFTVIEPPLPEEEDDGSGIPTVTSSDRLASRRTYDNDDGGPLYDGTVLADELNNVVVSAPSDVIEEDAELEITSFDPSQKQKDVVNELGYDLSLLYDIEFIKDTAIAKLNGEFEIGLPIDSGYQNGTIVIYRINDDGTVTPFSVRRSGGIAYAIVDGPGVYAVGIPLQTAGSGNTGLLGWIKDIWNTLMMLL